MPYCLIGFMDGYIFNNKDLIKEGYDLWIFISFMTRPQYERVREIYGRITLIDRYQYHMLNRSMRSKALSGTETLRCQLYGITTLTY